MTKTEHYSLPQWEAHDALKRSDFNEAMESIDKALGGGGQNCRIKCGIHYGNWEYGAEHPSSLTFDFKPLIIIMGCNTFGSYWLNPTIFLRGRTNAVSDIINNSTLQCNHMYVTWTDNGVSWYSTESSGGQNNNATSYYYVALGCDLDVEDP